MPTVTLTFTLPDEQAEYDAARTGAEARSVLREIDEHCRSLLKYGDPSAEAGQLAFEIRGMIRDSDERLLD